MNVVLCGMKHCGKTTHGRLLSQHLGCNFIDTDDLLVARYEQQHGVKLSPRSIFKKHGDDYFRCLEAESVKQFGLNNNNDDETYVVALGGGVPSNPYLDYVLIKQLGVVVYLKLPPLIIFKRIIRKGIPPMFQGENPFENFTALYNKREPDYIKCADLIIELNGNETVTGTESKIIAQIEDYLYER